MPASYTEGEFTSCEGELQEVVGTYTSNGQTLTWSQPASLTTSPPWTPVIPASSNCQTFSSAQLYAAAATSSLSGASSAAATKAPSAGASKATGATAPGAGATTGAAAATQASGAGKLVVNAGLSTMLAAVVVFLI
jgi:hypothetical protein